MSIIALQIIHVNGNIKRDVKGGDGMHQGQGLCDKVCTFNMYDLTVNAY